MNKKSTETNTRTTIPSIKIPEIPEMPNVVSRRPYYDSELGGDFYESLNDWYENNIVAVYWFLENAESIRLLLKRQQQSISKSDIETILEENLSVTDEWGGCKLASWQYGNNVVVDGIDSATAAIMDKLSVTKKD